MRRVRILLAALCGSSTAVGCFSSRNSAPDAFLVQADRNVVQSPIRDCDEIEFIKYLRKQAEKAWNQVCNSDRRHFPNPYREGFIEGFVDYVEAGGNGEPPYLPPFRYRLWKFTSADGVAAIEQWYAGFRHGAVAGSASGLRQLRIIPLPAPAIPIDPTAQYNAEAGKLSYGNPRSASEPSPWDNPRILPGPKPIPPAIEVPPHAPEPRPSLPPLNLLSTLRSSPPSGSPRDLPANPPSAPTISVVPNATSMPIPLIPPSATSALPPAIVRTSSQLPVSTAPTTSSSTPKNSASTDSAASIEDSGVDRLARPIPFVPFTSALTTLDSSNVPLGVSTGATSPTPRSDNAALPTAATALEWQRQTAPIAPIAPIAPMPPKSDLDGPNHN